MAAAVSFTLPAALAVTAHQRKKHRAAIIGHTGHGDYGHHHDVIFTDRSDVELVAIADPNAAGRAEAAKRSKAPRQYADYPEMLAREKPELVCIASRFADQHHAIGMAALKAGAHLYMEKPFTTTLAEADELIATAKKLGRKIAVAHQMRLTPSIRLLKQKLDAGFIGELLHIDAWGKQDKRAGGEDMLVLGTHLFDLMRYFAGDAMSCTARVAQQGKEITRADARPASEPVGTVAGDQIYAQFAFGNGVNASFTSRATLRESLGPWGLRMTGAKGAVRIQTGIYPSIFVQKPSKWETSGWTDQWVRMEDDPGINLSEEERGFGPANRRVVDDWLEAIRLDRDPSTSGDNAMKAIEMVMAVYQAALSASRAPLPLAQREHPLKV